MNGSPPQPSSRSFALLGKSLEPFVRIWWSGFLMGSSLGLAAVIAVTRFGLVALAAFFFAWRFSSAGARADQAVRLVFGGVSLFVFGVIFGIAGWALYVAITPLRHRAAGYSAHSEASQAQSSS